MCIFQPIWYLDLCSLLPRSVCCVLRLFSLSLSLSHTHTHKHSYLWSVFVKTLTSVLCAHNHHRRLQVFGLHTLWVAFTAMLGSHQHHSDLYCLRLTCKERM